MLSGYVFGYNLTDSTKVAISAQDSIGTYVPTMLFAVQNKVSGAYKWKKMYMSQLMGIMHDSVGAIIPRLTGTPTTNISLKTFSDNTLYRSDFNFNFKRIDSLTTVFSTNDFKLSGDTLKLKNPGGVDTTRIGFLAKGNVWTGSNVYSLGYIKLKNPATSYDITLTSLATANRTIYLPDVSSDTLAGRAWVRGTTTALPSQTGNNGKVLGTNGTIASWVAGGGSGVDTTKIGYLAKSNTWTNPNVFTQYLTLGQSSYWAGQIRFLNDINSVKTTLITGYPTGSDIIISLPSKSGTLALTSYIDTAKIGYLAKGNTWTNNNLFDNGYIFLRNPTTGYYTGILGSATATRTITFPNVTGSLPTIENSNTWTNPNYFNSGIQLGTGAYIPLMTFIGYGGSYPLYIDTPTLTAARTLTLPNETDTIATRGYVRSHGGSGGASLSGNNVWTGTNEYSNTVTFDAGYNVYMQSPPTIGSTGVTGSIKMLSGSSYGGYTTINPSSGLTNVTLTLPTVTSTIHASSGDVFYTPNNITSVASNTIDATGISNINCSLTSAATITYITGGVNGKILYLMNWDYPIIIHESSTTNSIHTGGRGDFTIAQNSCAEFIYNSSASGWFYVAPSADVSYKPYVFTSVTSNTIDVSGVPYVRYNSSSAATINLINWNGSYAPDGTIIYISNRGSGTLTIHEGTGGNGVKNWGAGDFNIPQYNAASFIFDASTDYWMHLK